MGKLTLKPMQDGAGYFYGNYRTADDRHVRIDVLPPLTFPHPRSVSDKSHMHPTAWLVFANGEELARVSCRDDVDALDIDRLLPPD